MIEGFVRAQASRGGLGLVLVGDGLRRKAVERAARRASHVHLLGAIVDRDRLARIYASADALVHGSGAETYGLVVAEAIASGLAIVVPDTGGASDFAGRARSAVYKTGDPAACAEAILRLLDQQVAGPPASNALVTAEAHFTQLFALYQRLVDARRSPTGS